MSRGSFTPLTVVAALTAVSLVCAPAAIAQERPAAPVGVWEHGAARVAMGEELSRVQARDRALAEARRRAVLAAVGSEIERFVLTVDRQSVQQLVIENTRGLLLGERDVTDRVTLDPAGAPVLELEGEFLVAVPSGSRDAAFHLRAGLERDAVAPGDDVALSVTPTADCWLYVFNVDGRLNVIEAGPRPTGGALWADAGRTVAWPTAADRQAGFSLRAQLPEGSRDTVERMFVIGVKPGDDRRAPDLGAWLAPDPSGSARPRRGSLVDVYRALAGFDRERWTSENLVLRIRR